MDVSKVLQSKQFVIKRFNISYLYKRKFVLDIEDDQISLQNDYIFDQGMISCVPQIVTMDHLKSLDRWDSCHGLFAINRVGTFIKENLLLLGQLNNPNAQPIKYTKQMLSYLTNSPTDQFFFVNEHVLLRSWHCNHIELSTLLKQDVSFAFDIRYDTDNFNETKYRIYLYKDDEFICNRIDEFVEIPSNEYVEAAMEFITFKLDMPSECKKDSYIVGTVSATADDEPLTKEVDIYVSSDGGYLPKTKFTMKKDPITFKLFTTGLDSGDKITVHVGPRYQPKFNTKIITII